MCAIFKIALAKSPEIFNKLKDRYGEDEAKKYLDSTMFPKAEVPVLGPERKVAVMSWGYPMNGKSSVVFNARSETLDTKPMFKTSLKNHCIVPATAFYEWGNDAGDGDKKQKYLISIKNNENIFYFAGLWKKFIDKDGNKFFAFTILTTSPNGDMAKIHSRMPVILSGEHEKEWLESESYEKNILTPYAGELVIEKAL